MCVAQARQRRAQVVGTMRAEAIDNGAGLIELLVHLS
ncbi:hypothetical protein ACVMIX_005168 [Rhizobium leguminosarum]|uniref:Uncharacterized protein n=1 Tax=Rhizobium leguminosarum TaxID=384 RepID=A0A2Z4YPY5_RHILE|nr:hypothetical protein DLJ82_7255 [Rhizobium leguminosarum]MBA9036456.1 hypothetical protein [Rhizobium leguminosarum]